MEVGVVFANIDRTTTAVHNRFIFILSLAMSTTIVDTQTQSELFSRLKLRGEPIGNVKDLVLQDGKCSDRRVRTIKVDLLQATQSYQGS